MDTNLVALNEKNIRTAIVDYRRHTSEVTVLDDISEDFIQRLAVDSFNSKAELRNLFSTSPAWNEDLQAIVINGTRTHNPDSDKIEDLAFKILKPFEKDAELCHNIIQAIHFFSKTDDNLADYISAINFIAPKAYSPNKKKSRIFKAICDALSVSDNSAGSDFQKLFAQLADEISSKKIDFKLFVSINPAHFLTMSNPKFDERGSTMVSCHSLNSTEYSYNCGCSGYARDNYSFIIFTASDPNNPETLNNRKTSRQIFAYKPNNGLLLQSRMYTTNSGGSYGGVNGDTEEGKLYRDLIQREISELENVPNLWITRNYYENEFEADIRKGIGFGGYADWLKYTDCAKISVRKDKLESFNNFAVGTYGLCISCAEPISSGLYCDCCKDESHEICDDCGEECDEVFPVHNRRSDTIYVCSDCRDANYRYCDSCEEYYPCDQMTYTGDDEYICENCLHDHFFCCDICHEYFHESGCYDAIDSNGYEITVCESCRDRHTHTCNNCGCNFQFSSNSDTVYHSCQNRVEEVDNHDAA